jgi:hypothetical protein
MDLDELIAKLRIERTRLDQIIRSLEQLPAEARPVLRSNQGRKFMGAAERTEVSECMRNYWASRRLNANP